MILKQYKRPKDWVLNELLEQVPYELLGRVPNELMSEWVTSLTPELVTTPSPKWVTDPSHEQITIQGRNELLGQILKEYSPKLSKKGQVRTGFWYLSKFLDIF